MKQPTVPTEDLIIERELWAGDQANTAHEERAVRELYRRRLRIEELEAALRTILPLAEHYPCELAGSEGAREMRSVCSKIAAEVRAVLQR